MPAKFAIARDSTDGSIHRWDAERTKNGYEHLNSRDR